VKGIIMFKNFIRKLDHVIVGLNVPHSEDQDIFNSIYGYEDIKKLLARCIATKDSIHVLLTGLPASSKTLFLLEIMQYFGPKKCYFFDGTSTTGAGLLDYLFAHPNIQHILIDEIDKMKRSDQVVLLGLMETGMLVSTKVRKTSSIKMINSVKVFATSNSQDRLSKPLKSRFSIFNLPEYTYEQFEGIATKLLDEKYGLPQTTAIKIANGVWTQLNSKDIRDILKIGKLVKSNDDIQWLIDMHKKYRWSKEGEDID
jgi:replication-associated recombination protein RarA